jgi:bifunctional non-homologous end joining protein LigD
LTADDRLEKYRRKRSAGETPEPFGVAGARASTPPDGDGPAAPRLFVVQMHHARNLHWDLRLEMDGALESWAVPKGPSPDPADKRLAMHVEPHPLEYAEFEGVIPEGQYGAGPSICWDRGVWIEIPAGPGEKPHGLEHGKLLFELRGYKLRGLWTLVHTPRNGDNHWLLIKERDGYVDETGTELYAPDSIYSGLTVDELPDPDGKRGRILAQAREAGAKVLPDSGLDPGGLEVMKAVPADDPFSRKGWVFEIKYDGYRLVADRTGTGATLWSRNGNDLTETFPEIARAVRGLPFPGAVLDGEVVVHDPRGLPSFALLQKRGRLQRASDVARAAVQLPATYYAFDLLAFGGLDLRPLPLTERKALLRELLPTVGPIRYSDHIEREGKAVWEQAERLGIEGIVAKKARSRYVAGRSESWVKIRTVRTDDFVVVGWTEPKGSRTALGALHLAQWELEPPDSAVLRYSGTVGTGFDQATLDELAQRLRPIEREECPCRGGEIPTGKGHHWTEPVLVAEVRYKEVTPAGMLRHPSFLRLREDKTPEECRSVPLLAGDEDDSETLLPEPAPVTGGPKKEVALTNLDKQLFPPCPEPLGAAPGHDGIPKGEMVRYYQAVAPWMLPYLKDRCLVVTRYPDGIDGNSFYQKNAPDWAPDWIRTQTVFSEGSERDLDYFVVEDVESLVYIANSAALLVHIWSSRAATLAQPDWCVIDLDPKGAPFEHVVELALLIRELGEEGGFPTYAKTSGSSGLHVLIPLGGQLTHQQSRQLGQLLATLAVAEKPEIATVDRVVDRRQGKVYVDYLQNGWGKLLVAPYSTRPVPEAAVSMPLEWSEVTPELRPRDFTLRNALERVESWDGDPMRPVLRESPDLLAGLEALMSRVREG